MSDMPTTRTFRICGDILNLQKSAGKKYKYGDDVRSIYYFINW